MTIARQFKAFAISMSLLAVAFAATLAWQFSTLSAQGTRLLDNLQHTSRLAQQLAGANTGQVIRLRTQFERLEPTYGDEIRALEYSLGDKYAEYLKLDLDEHERLTVERIKALQSESTLVVIQTYQYMRAGDVAAADARVAGLYALHGELRNEFDGLSDLQMRKMGAVVNHLSETSRRALAAVGGLVVALTCFTAAFVVLLRRRVLTPVREILDASDRMRLGDLTARAPARRADELGRLTQGFNYMAASLAASHADLERKVEERAAQLHEMQAQLVRADKLSAVGLLVSGVAHELNNPLAAIRGFAEMARMEIDEGTLDRTRLARTLVDMDGQIERCRRIVINLLQFARQHEAKREHLDINGVVEPMLQLREYELGISNVRIVREFDPRNPGLVADRDRIQQVVLNLLNNACDAIKDAGRPGTITVRTGTDDAHVTVEFEDDGPGFADPGRAFDPFYTTKEVGKGTGLGLSVCYGIVTDHGGEIHARNLARGARVTVRLPAAAAAGEGTHQAEPAPGGGPVTTTVVQGGRVLVVDDEEPLRRLQVSFLRRIGFDAEAVASGAEAIAYLEAHPVDLVVSDVRMPGSIDGVALFEWIEAHQPDLARRFVFVSGDLVGLNLDGFFQRGTRIEKPFGFAEYTRVIRELLEREA